MTRRNVIFYNDLNNSYIVSEEYNGDKVEMARFGLGICEHSWEEFMEAMDSVQNLADFLKVISQTPIATMRQSMVCSKKLESCLGQELVLPIIPKNFLIWWAIWTRCGK